MPNSFDKEKYVLHYENLKLYLRLGLKLKEIHRILELNQSQWLKQYIQFNTQKKNRSREKWSQRWKSIVQINEQCCIQQNNGKLEKWNRCKASKQPKRLFKMYIKTKLYVAQNI